VHTKITQDTRHTAQFSFLHLHTTPTIDRSSYYQIMARIKKPPRLGDPQTPFQPRLHPISPDNPLGRDDNLQYYPPDSEPPQPASHYRGQPNAGFLYASQDLLRIHWPIFGELSDIMVLDDPTDAHSDARPFQLPDGSLHPVAEAAITDPHCCSIEIGLACLPELSFATMDDCAEDCDQWKTEDRLGEDGEINCSCGAYYRAPERKKVVATPKRSAVTLKDFITTLSPYFKSLKDDVLRANSLDLPLDSLLRSETQFFACLTDISRSDIRVFRDEGEQFTQWEWDTLANHASRLKITPQDLR
jgi:hypothetical protein